MGTLKGSSDLLSSAWVKSTSTRPFPSTQTNPRCCFVPTTVSPGFFAYQILPARPLAALQGHYSSSTQERRLRYQVSMLVVAQSIGPLQRTLSM